MSRCVASVPTLSWRGALKSVAAPLRTEEQESGQVRFWGEVILPGETAPRYLRVVTLEDGETIHNAFFDRRFRKEEQA